jgi:hypothetical protein
MSRFTIGDRVTRPQYLDDGTWAQQGDACLADSPRRHGTVTKVYAEPRHRCGALWLGPYPELYQVLWDDGPEKGGYLPHGLDQKDSST